MNQKKLSEALEIAIKALEFYGVHKGLSNERSEFGFASHVGRFHKGNLEHVKDIQGLTAREALGQIDNLLERKKA